MTQLTEYIKTEKLLLLSVSVLLLIIYLPVLSDLVDTWYNDDNYSHGFLVPFVAAYFIWSQRKSLRTIDVKTDKLGLIIMIFGLLVFIVGNAGSEYFTVGVSFVFTLFGLTHYLLGREIIKRIWFSLFLLFFMIPIPAVLYFSATFPMQLFASKVTVFLLDALGMPIIRQGNIIHLPEHVLEVAEACSGLRSLISLLAMGAIYGYLTQKKFWAKTVLFLSSVPIAIFGNVVRVFITAILTYAFDIDTTTEPWHTIMGSLVFVISFICLFIGGAILRKFQE